MKRFISAIVAALLLNAAPGAQAQAQDSLVAQRQSQLATLLADAPRLVTLTGPQVRDVVERITAFPTTQPASLFEGDKVRSDLCAKAMAFAQERFRDLKLPQLRILDMLFVGSLASYEYDDLSDVDVHIIIDPASWSGDAAFLRRYLSTVNDLNEFLYDRITMFGRKADFTFYADTVENRIEPGVGVYSLFKEAWLEPPKAATTRFSREAVETDLIAFVKRFNDLVGAYASDKKSFACGGFSGFREEVRLYRRKGIARDGIRSTENIVYRALRRINDNLLLETERLGLECENIQASL